MVQTTLAEPGGKSWPKHISIGPQEADSCQGAPLHSGGEVELVAGAGETAKAHTLEAMLDLQVCKTHLYFLARIARSLELRRAL
jgi:hypothetical protein